MYLKVSQLDIAPTIAEIYGLTYSCEGMAIDGVVKKYYGLKTILLIIDSLGFKEYLRYKGSLRTIHKLANNGMIYKCKIFTRYTTPAIATILCGRRPESHRIYLTGDVYKTEITSIPEFLFEHGFKSGVVMEKNGAVTFKGKVDSVMPIEDREDIINFDINVRDCIINLIKNRMDFITAHLRSLDKLGYNDTSLKCINDCIYKIIKTIGSDWLIIICGDHPPHKSRSEYTPLIFGKKADIQNKDTKN